LLSKWQTFFPEQIQLNCTGEKNPANANSPAADQFFATAALIFRSSNLAGPERLKGVGLDKNITFSLIVKMFQTTSDIEIKLSI